MERYLSICIVTFFLFISLSPPPKVCLLLSKPRQATVVAEEIVHTISIDRQSFQRLVGPLKGVLDRAPHCYNDFIARYI